MSLFLALRAPAALQEAVRAWHPPGELGLRRPDPAQLHLTLAFLGEASEARCDAVADLAAAAAREHPPFTLRAAGLGAFPSPASARVLWWGVDAHPELTALAATLRERLVAAAIPFDPKPFRAHLTLGRFPKPRVLPALDPPATTLWPVSRLALLESLPGGSGVRHGLRGEWPLTGGEARP